MIQSLITLQHIVGTQGTYCLAREWLVPAQTLCSAGRALWGKCEMRNSQSSLYLVS